MKRSGWSVTIVLLGSLAIVGCHSPREDQVAQLDRKGPELVERDDREMKERDETKRSYQLRPGASVEVEGINGVVEVETVAGSDAEVSVERLAATRAALEDNKIIVEQTPEGLRIRGERLAGNFLLNLVRSESPRYREIVKLKLPSQVNVSASGVNGRVTIGAIEGNVNVDGVNGVVTLAAASGDAEVSGVNGKVTLGFRELGERGVDVYGVNGPVDIGFAEGVNASVEAEGINGGVASSAADFAVERDKNNQHSFRARIGAGGAPVSLNGINGQINLRRLAAG